MVMVIIICKATPNKDEEMDMSLDLSIMGGIFEFVSCNVEPDYETDDLIINN